MDLPGLLFTILTGGAFDVEVTAAALLARGQIAIRRTGSVTGDEVLRELGSRALAEAALHPGLHRLQSRLAESCSSLDHGGFESETAERAIADILSHRDQWLMRARALTELGLESLARQVHGEILRLDAALESNPAAFGAVSWLQEDALAASSPWPSIWSRVPAPSALEPECHPAWVEPVTEDDLAQVALGLACPALTGRVSHAIASDPELRARYDALLEDADVFIRPPEVPLPLREGAVALVGTRPAVHEGAASGARPAAEQAAFVFPDGSELFVRRRPGGWLLSLARRTAGTDDGISGAVQHVRADNLLMVASVSAGEVEIHCGEASRRFVLGPVGE